MRPAADPGPANSVTAPCHDWRYGFSGVARGRQRRGAVGCRASRRDPAPPGRVDRHRTRRRALPPTPCAVPALRWHALGDVDLARAGCDRDASVAGRCRGTPAFGRRDAAVAAAGAVDRRNPFRSQGFFSAKTVIKHMCKLSGPEAHRRVQTARLHEALPAWADAEADGEVGVAQSELMARIAANPRIESAVLERDSPDLLDDAIEQSFDEFERRARTWEALADPAGDLAKNERQHANRTSADPTPTRRRLDTVGNLRRTRRRRVQRRSSPGSSKPNGLADWADARAPPRRRRHHRRPCTAPKHNDEPTPSSRWPAPLPPHRPDRSSPARPSTS